MACSVVAISRALGAGGEQVGSIVARELGFRYVDNDIIDTAAREAGVSPEAVGAAEHTESLFTRVFSSMAAGTPEGAMIAPEAAMMPAYTKSYQSLIESVIKQTADAGKAVIVAHGASIPLAGTSGLLRVLVTASPETRVKRVGAENKLSEKDSEKTVEESDKQRAQFLRRFYDVRQESPLHYDLVVNTDTLSSEAAAGIVLAAARGR